MGKRLTGGKGGGRGKEKNRTRNEGVEIRGIISSFIELTTGSQ